MVHDKLRPALFWIELCLMIILPVGLLFVRNNLTIPANLAFVRTRVRKEKFDLLDAYKSTFSLTISEHFREDPYGFSNRWLCFSACSFKVNIGNSASQVVTTVYLQASQSIDLPLSFSDPDVCNAEFTLRAPEEFQGFVDGEYLRISASADAERGLYRLALHAEAEDLTDQYYFDVEVNHSRTEFAERDLMAFLF